MKEDIKSEEEDKEENGGGINGMMKWKKVELRKFGEIEEVEMGRIKKIYGEKMRSKWVMIKNVNKLEKKDIKELEELSKKKKEEEEKSKMDVKIKKVVLIMKEVDEDIEKMNRLNS